MCGFSLVFRVDRSRGLMPAFYRRRCRRIRGMKTKANTILFALLLGGCALQPAWRWEKVGAGEVDYQRDEKFCKLQAYSGADGMVTGGQVRQMHRCLEGRGWRKIAHES